MVSPRTAGALSARPTIVITKDPDSGWINLGTYRSQLLEKNKMGTQFIKGKHADIMLKKYQALKKPMPVAWSSAVILCCFSWARPGSRPLFPNTMWPAPFARGPIEVVKGETSDLPIPAHAEIVIEAISGCRKIFAGRSFWGIHWLLFRRGHGPPEFY